VGYEKCAIFLSITIVIHNTFDCGVFIPVSNGTKIIFKNRPRNARVIVENNEVSFSGHGLAYFIGELISRGT